MVKKAFANRSDLQTYLKAYGMAEHKEDIYASDKYIARIKEIEYVY